MLVGAGVLATASSGPASSPRWTKARSCSTTSTPGGTALAETDRQLHIVEQILATTPEIVGTSRRTGAELGLFATEQNTGDIVARLDAASAARPRRSSR